MDDLELQYLAAEGFGFWSNQKLGTRNCISADANGNITELMEVATRVPDLGTKTKTCDTPQLLTLSPFQNVALVPPCQYPVNHVPGLFRKLCYRSVPPLPLSRESEPRLQSLSWR